MQQNIVLNVLHVGDFKEQLVQELSHTTPSLVESSSDAHGWESRDLTSYMIQVESTALKGLFLIMVQNEYKTML